MLGFFGDSLTDGQDGFGRFSDLVGSWLGDSVYNPSVGGEKPWDIATRQGGAAVSFTVADDTIPTTTDWFSIGLVSPSDSGFSGSSSPSYPDISYFASGMFKGIPVAVRKTDADGWEMQRLTEGNVEVAVEPGGERFYVPAGAANRDAIQVYWPGHNNADQSMNLAAVEAMSDFCTSGKWIVLSILTTSSQVSGSGGYITRTATNAAMAAAHPDNYIDIRRYLIDWGLADAGITPTSEDGTAVAGDTIPPSLLRDGDDQHLNAVGHWLVARQVAQFIIDQEWWPETNVEIPPSKYLGEAMVDLPTSSAYLQRTVSAPVQALQAFRLEILCRFDTRDQTQTIAHRSITDGDRVWQWQLLSGNPRFRYFPAGTNASVIEATSTAEPSLSDGTWYWLRVDVNAASRSVRHYYSTVAIDGTPTSWTQAGSTITGAATSFPDDDVPLRVGLFAGAMRRFQLLSYDGVTTYIDDNFESGLDPDWTLNGGALLVPMDA